MVRPTQLIHPQRDPVEVRPAATVLLLRDTPEGFEVLMTRRSHAASFAAGAYVFPGGAIDAADAQGHAHSSRRPTQSDTALTQAIAAIRESFEELGLLLARHRDGRIASADDIAAMDRKAPFLPQCEARGLQLAGDEVFTLAHWTTDRDLTRRFDVPFLIARAPTGQEPVADETEQFEPLWIRPAEAIERQKAGTMFIIFPTLRTLERLAAYQTVGEVISACAPKGQPERVLWTSCPRGGLLNRKEVRYMEHESPFGELALTSPDGQIVHQLDWQHEQPVGLLKNVRRLTAPNPGVMTGPGTNTYLIGDADSGYFVLDPGPADNTHLERIWTACSGQIRSIICTHSHPDHSPGAAPLQALSNERVGHKPPILGLPSGPEARASHQFTPERSLRDGEPLSLRGGGQTHTLLVLHTPGHAANHLCLVLLEDGLLFSGDHVLNGSTTIIDPPDGDMTAYLASLDKLRAACDTHSIEFILPAHGHVLGFAPIAIDKLKAHRLLREAKVQAVMEAHPEGSLDSWVPMVYDDVPPRMWPVAKRSLQAHVQRLEQLRS